MVEWLQQSFSYMNNPSNLYKKGDRKLSVKAVNLKEKSHLVIDFENDLSEGTCEVKIMCPNMELASDVVQSLFGDYLKFPMASSKAHFPNEYMKLQAILAQIKESNLMKTHFAANIADSIQNLKVAVVKAEASLLIYDIPGLRKNYALVQQENGNLIGEYLKRTNNHSELV